MKSADWVSLSNVSLSFPCVLGISEWERRAPQTLQLELAMSLDLDGAAAGDLRHSVDYAAALDHVQFIAQRGRWMLLESMASAIARFVLAAPAAGERRAQVRAVLVRLHKPDVFGGRAIPGIEIQRDQAWYEPTDLPAPFGDGCRIEVVHEARQTGAYRVHLAAGARFSSPPGMSLQVISGHVTAGGVELAPRATLDPAERVVAPAGGAPACLLGVCQPPLGAARSPAPTSP